MPRQPLMVQKGPREPGGLLISNKFAGKKGLCHRTVRGQESGCLPHSLCALLTRISSSERFHENPPWLAGQMADCLGKAPEVGHPENRSHPSAPRDQGLRADPCLNQVAKWDQQTPASGNQKLFSHKLTNSAMGNRAPR